MTTIRDFHNQITGIIALAILVVGFVLAPQERLDKVGHAIVAFGSTSYGVMIYGALASIAVAVLRWALARIPTGAVANPKAIGPQKVATVLVAFTCLAASSLLHGCGGAQLTPTQRGDLATETQRCLINERAIVDDPCGTLTTAECHARDDAARTAERARCDAARAAIVGGAQ